MQGRKRYLTHHITGVYKKLIVKLIVKNFVYTISLICFSLWPQYDEVKSGCEIKNYLHNMAMYL